MEDKNINYIVDSSKKIIVFGAGIVARGVIITLREILGGVDRIECCAVNNYNHNPSTVEGIKVIEIGQITHPKDYVVLIAVKKMYLQDVEKSLKNHGFNDYMCVSQDLCVGVLEDKWVKKYEKISRIFDKNGYKSGLTKEEQITFLSRQLNDNNLSFEVNLADHCNLNCQSCNHFSPLAKEKFLNLTEYSKDINRISNIFKGKIGTIMLLGGEPLLHPKIEEVIRLTRKTFEQTEISIVSNGIALLKMKDTFWKACCDNGVDIVLTKYPIKLDYNRFEELAKSYGVSLTYTLDSLECKTTYKLPLDVYGNQKPYSNYAKCYHANKCVVLKEGRLYTCPIAAYIDILNWYYNLQFPEGEVNSIDIYTADDMDQIMTFLKKPIPMCNYCKVKDYEYDIPWRVSNKELSEWI